MLKVLQTVADQKLGYSYGKPLRVDEKSLAVVLPILRKTSLTRQYITFPETEKVLVFDTGKIDEMEAENQTDSNVFIRSGTLFRGSTQERALQRSAVLFPGRKVKLGVRCVHASRGISPNASVKYGGITPLAFDTANYAHGYTFADQGATWSNVLKATTEMNAKMGKPKPAPNITGAMRMSSLSHRDGPIGASGPLGASGPAGVAGDAGAYYMSSSADSVADMAANTMFTSNIHASAFSGPKADDLHTSFHEFAKHFDDILSKVKMVDDQAGLALITQAGVETVEFFDHHLSWKALHEAAVKRLGSSIVDDGDENVFDYKPEAAIKQVNKVLGIDFKSNLILEHRPSNGEPKIVITGLTGGGYVGEVVELDERVIHLVLLKQAA